MNCTQIQQRLLALGRPDRPPPDIVEHLARCAQCGAWQRRLTNLERHAARLPVPATAVRDRLLEELRRPAQTRSEPTGEPLATNPQAPASTPLSNDEWSFAGLPPRAYAQARQSARHRWIASATAAAALILVVSGWSLLQRYVQPSVNEGARTVSYEDQVLSTLVDHDLKLARSSTASERLELLSGLADSLYEEANRLRNTRHPEDLNILATQYEHIVRDGVLARASDLPQAGRRELLSAIAERLRRTAADATRSARGRLTKQETSLGDIAKAAADGDRELQALLGDSTR
jgi:hypothetical protein